MDSIKRRRGRPSTKTQLDRDELLQCALRAFARYGFDGVKLSALAKKAGIANSLLNYYFKSKEDLWKQALQYAFTQLQEKFKSVHRNFKDLEGVPLLKVLTRQGVYFAAEFPEYQEILIHELKTQSERSKWLMENLMSPLYEQAEKIFQKEQEKGNIKKLPAINMLLMSIGASNMFFHYSSFLENKHGIKAYDEDQIEQHADAVIEVLFNGIITSES